MRTILINLLCSLLIFSASAALSFDDIYKRYGWDYYQESAELTRPDLTMIWHQLIPPRDAARSLIRGLNYTLIPSSFNRNLHHLHYQVYYITSQEVCKVGI